MTAITDLTAVDLSRAIHAREISCVEVMRAHLAQVDRCNPVVNAIVSRRDPDALLREARDRDVALARGDDAGWMHGFPQAPKDLAAVAGMVTTMGSPIFRDAVTGHDAIVVERMRRAGSIFFGRTNTPELGLGSHTYNTVHGVTRNAWDPSKSAGGSSGGAAVALATRMLPVADGSDMMGSLRNPAGWNGVVGLRPSFGRVPHGPATEVFIQQLGTEGPMGRTVADVAMLLSVQAGFDPRVPLAIDQDPSTFATALAANLRGTRVGWLGDFDGHLPMEAGVLDTCVAALDHFRAFGCTVEAATPDFDMERLWATWRVLRHFAVAGSAGALYADPERRTLLKPEAIWEIEGGLALSAMDVQRASVDRTAWSLALERLFRDHDVLVLPTAQCFPFDAELDWPKAVAGRAMDTYHRWMEIVIGGTLAGLPVLAVPAGFGPGGLPMGLQIIGRPQADLDVLRIGYAYEEASGFTRMRPPTA